MSDQKGPSASLGEQYRAAMRSRFPPDPQHPVRTALREAYIDRGAQLFDFVSSEEIIDGVGQVHPHWQEYIRLVDEANELAGWASDPISAEQAERLDSVMGDALQQLGHSYSEVRKLLETTSTAPRGRPVTKRRTAVEALELRLADQAKWSWARLAREFCGCGSSLHSHKCQEAIRKEVGHLQSLLKKYQITLPAPATPRK
jgi:hypothetical protein